jgi:hypothetical protein
LRIAGTHLTYCLNIHPGESLAEARSNIERHAAAVKARVSPDEPFCLGLRLSARAAAEVEPEVDEFRRWLDGLGMYSVTVNGFPYGRFHGTRVKRDVYQPDWTTPERAEYTLSLARTMGILAPEGEAASISTLPISYGRTADDGALRNLAQVVRELEKIERSTGRTVRLALEPEPDCFLESADECIDLWNRLREHGVADSAPLGVCLDACHAAVNFLSPTEELGRLKEAGIPVFKIHISAGLVAVGAEGAGAREALAGFDEDTYLHQTRIADPGGAVRRFADLPDALASEAEGEWRVHFHVPLHWEGTRELRSTAAGLDAAFMRAAVASGAHLEVETYTFGVMPGRTEDVDESVACEVLWAAERLRG